MVLHELIQTVELDNPQEKLALSISKHFKVLNPVAALDAERKVPRGRLGDPDHESALVFVEKQLLCVCPSDAAVVPAVRLHLDVVARNEPFLAVELCSVPVHVILLVEDLEYLVLPEAQLIICGGIEVVLGDRLHLVVLGFVVGLADGPLDKR